MGVFSTLVLLLKGYNVKLISNVLPEKNTIFNGRKEHMASQVAAGVYLPTFFDRRHTPEEFRMIKETFDLIVDLEKQKK